MYYNAKCGRGQVKSFFKEVIVLEHSVQKDVI